MSPGDQGQSRQHSETLISKERGEKERGAGKMASVKGTCLKSQPVWVQFSCNLMQKVAQASSFICSSKGPWSPPPKCKSIDQKRKRQEPALQTILLTDFGIALRLLYERFD